MQDIPIFLLISGLAALGSGATLGFVHFLRPDWNPHYLIRYVIGSTACLTAATLIILLRTGGDWLLVMTMWAVWAVSGAFVAAAYHAEEMASLRRGSGKDRSGKGDNIS